MTSTKGTIRRSMLGLFAAGALLVAPQATLAGEISGRPVGNITIEGAADGPSVLVYLPPTAHSSTLGTWELLSRVELDRGSMTLLAGSPGERVPNLPKDPDWVLLVEESWLLHDTQGEVISHPIVRSNRGDLALNLVQSAVAPSFPEDQPEWSILPMTNAQSFAGEGMIVLTLPTREVPASRRNRWSRNMALDLMVELEMLGERPAPAILVEPHALGFALYDANGIGGIGPHRMERIINEFPDNVPVMRICPEDIHDGILTAFDGAIFPGGSGRGIAVGLQEKGVAILDEYIRGGGGYMGICAGAYFANSGVDVYLRAVPIVHDQPWRKGRGMLDIELTAKGRDILGEEFTTFSTRYGNGPVYLEEVNPLLWEEDSEVTVLAHFRSTVNDPNGEPSEELLDTPAFMSYRHGEGNMILISPHPETHPELFPMLQRALLWMTGRTTLTGGAISGQ